MIRQILLYAILLISHIATTSCERQEILIECPCSNYAKIPVTVDWSRSGITPKNVTLLVYNDSDGSLALKHEYEHNSNPVHTYMHIHPGKYSIVIFNELSNQIDYVRVEGSENISTLAFHVIKKNNVFTRSTDYEYVNQPGELGVKIVRNMVVNDDLVSYTYDKGALASDDTKASYEMLLNLSPDNKLTYLDVTVHVKGLNNARMPAMADLLNVANAHHVNDDINSTTTSTVQFDIGNIIFNPGSTTDGTVSSRVALWGVVGDRDNTTDQPKDAPIILDMLFMLVDKDKTIIRHKVDITDSITFKKETSGIIVMSTDIDLLLPDVEPESGGDGSGFDTELDDWDVIDIPL